MISKHGVLFIEPSADTSYEPVIDELTRKMTAALRRSSEGPAYRGWHTCACGARSGNSDLILPNGLRTNSLCVHYLAVHRSEVPPEELEKVKNLECGEEEPTAAELAEREGSKNVPHHRRYLADR